MSLKLAITVLLAAIVAILLHTTAAQEDSNVIKVGILHSLTGTISASEIPLRYTIEWLINKTNAQGGVLGKKLVSVVENPASNWYAAVRAGPCEDLPILKAFIC